MLLFLLPFVEVYLLIKVGRRIDAIPTISLIVFTGVLGVLLLRHQGIYTIRRLQKSLEQGQLPAMAMLEGVMIMLSGVLLLIPGFLTDTVGVLLLVPPLRRFLIARFVRGLLPVASVPAGEGRDGGERHRVDEQGHNIIEGEYRREDRDRD